MGRQHLDVAFAGSERSQVFGDTGLLFWPSVLLILQRDVRKGLECGRGWPVSQDRLVQWKELYCLIRILFRRLRQSAGRH